jgi:Family of unknown function (DUF5681)
MTKQYDVGYGKPPNKHQFKKGKSGNPSGRPKRFWGKPPLDFQDILIASLKSPMTIIEGGKKKKLPTLEVFSKSLLQRAIKGDKTATKYVVDFIQKQPKYPFEGDAVAYVVTKKQAEAQAKALEKLRELAKLYNEPGEPNSNQDQGNGSPSLLGPAAGAAVSPLSPNFCADVSARTARPNALGRSRR